MIGTGNNAISGLYFLVGALFSAVVFMMEISIWFNDAVFNGFLPNKRGLNIQNALSVGIHLFSLIDLLVLISWWALLMHDAASISTPVAVVQAPAQHRWLHMLGRFGLLGLPISSYGSYRAWLDPQSPMALKLRGSSTSLAFAVFGALVISNRVI